MKAVRSKQSRKNSIIIITLTLALAAAAIIYFAFFHTSKIKLFTQNLESLSSGVNHVYVSGFGVTEEITDSAELNSIMEAISEISLKNQIESASLPENAVTVLLRFTKVDGSTYTMTFPYITFDTKEGNKTYFIPEGIDKTTTLLEGIFNG